MLHRDPGIYLFRSAPRAGGDPRYQSGAAQVSVSIRARAGATSLMDASLDGGDVSIRAPAQGTTQVMNDQVWRQVLFRSAPPRRGRQGV